MDCLVIMRIFGGMNSKQAPVYSWITRVKMCVFCCLFLSFSELTAQDSAPDLSSFAFPSVLSSFEGSRALIDITENEKWHKLLDINPSDLEKLRELRSGKEIDELIRKVGPKNELELKKLKERLVSERLSGILDPRQLDLRRVSILRERYSSPIGLFNRSASLLLELGMSQKQFDELRVQAFSKNKEIRTAVDNQIMDCLKSISQGFSKDRSSRLWAMFGRDFGSLPRSDFSWDQIQALPGTGPKMQLSFANMLVLDEDLKLSHPQQVEIASLEDKELLSPVDNAAKISSELNRILSKSQRAAIVQGLQRSLLVEDMKVLLSNEVVNYLGLDRDEAKSMSEIVEPAAKRIRKFRLEKQTILLGELITVMPKDYQNRLMIVVEGVWD